MFLKFAFIGLLLVSRFFQVAAWAAKVDAGRTTKNSPSGVPQSASEGAKAEILAENLETFSLVNQRYLQAKTIKLTLKKRVLQPVLGRETRYEGKLWASKEHLRIEFTKPIYSLVVVDGKYIWMVNSVPDDLGGGTQVARTKMDKRKKSQGWMALLGRKKITDSFTIMSVSADKGLLKFELEPKSGTQDLTKAELEIDPQKSEIVQIKYWDELENETVINLESVVFGSKIKPGLFAYKPPKGVEVTNY